MFSIDVDGREYWITATHILTGAKGRPFGRLVKKVVELKVLSPASKGEQWVPVKFDVLQPEEDVDVTVLVPEKALLNKLKLPSPIASSKGLTFGGPCGFMGYPRDGRGWRTKMTDGSSFWMPFVKHCHVSGLDTEARIWILDGINNPGFSGGPVFSGTGTALQFVGVISGYYPEPAEVIRASTAKIAKDIPKDRVNLNSGLIVAYDISHAVDIIKKNPIGPKRVPE